MIAVSRPVSITSVHLRKWCVYAHIVEGEVVYIGKGNQHRPFHHSSRSKDWIERMQAVTVFDVAILGWFESESAALKSERSLIRKHKPLLNYIGAFSRKPFVIIHIKLRGCTARDLAERAKAEGMTQCDLVRLFIERGLAQREASL